MGIASRGDHAQEPAFIRFANRNDRALVPAVEHRLTGCQNQTALVLLRVMASKAFGLEQPHGLRRQGACSGGRTIRNRKSEQQTDNYAMSSQIDSQRLETDKDLDLIIINAVALTNLAEKSMQ